MRIKANRHSPLSYGALAAGPIDDALTVAWTRPQITDEAVRNDGTCFPGGKTFVPLDDPGAVAQAISDLISDRPATPATPAAASA